MTTAAFRYLSALLLSLAVGACAAHLPPAGAPSPALILNETLPPETRLCVVRNPWHDGTLVCVTLAELRALARGQRETALEVRR